MAQKILIAGAGIGGLTAASCLLKAGYDVLVLEQAPALAEIGAAIALSANATREYAPARACRRARRRRHDSHGSAPRGTGCR
jgi:salicylate hydroxylase